MDKDKQYEKGKETLAKEVAKALKTEKDYKGVTADMKQIYRLATEDEALQDLDQFGEQQDDNYPKISRSWHNHWQSINTLFGYPNDSGRKSTLPT